MHVARVLEARHGPHRNAPEGRQECCVFPHRLLRDPGDQGRQWGSSSKGRIALCNTHLHWGRFEIGFRGGPQGCTPSPTLKCFTQSDTMVVALHLALGVVLLVLEDHAGSFVMLPYVPAGLWVPLLHLTQNELRLHSLLRG